MQFSTLATWCLFLGAPIALGPPVLQFPLVLYSQGYGSAGKPLVSSEDVLPGLAEGGICPEGLWVQQEGRKDLEEMSWGVPGGKRVTKLLALWKSTHLC